MSSSASLKDKEIAPHVALIAVQVMFGTWPIFGKIVLRTISSTGLVGVRILGATVVFALFHSKAREIFNLSKSTLGSLLLCSLLGVVINQLLFVKGLSYTTVINATLITTTIPVFTLAISIILGHDRATWRHILGIALAAAGVAYLVNPFRATLSAQTTLGNILIVINSLSYGAYIPLSRDLVKRHGALNVTTWLFMIASVITLPLTIYTWSDVPINQLPLNVWLSLAYIVVVPTVGAYLLNAWALTRVSPGIVAIYIYLQPLIAFGLAPLVLGETLNSRTIVACLLIFAGVAVVTIFARSRAVEEVSEHPEAMAH
ncbi:MAG TPA: DMT family transporter [Pyrinomonadaceae bacterium]|nr:DMT family transporter [Pyrinomonadaceae bacterium]